MKYVNVSTMKTSALLVLFSFVVSSAFAKNVEPRPNVKARSLAGKFQICPKLKELQTEFGMTLNPANPNDFEKGASELIEARNCLLRFEQAGGKVEDPMFPEILQLVAVALPFDVESDVAGLLSNIVQTPSAEAVFKTELEKVTDVCRRNLLLDSVYARICDAQPKNLTCKKLPPQDATCDKKLSPAPSAD